MTEDEALAAQLAVDLNAHFPTLVRNYQDRLFAFALRMTASAPDAEESTQDAFVRAYRALRNYPPDRIASLQVRAWLYRITLNVVRNRLRRARPQVVDVDGPLGTTLAASPADQPEARAEAAERRGLLARAIGELPSRYAAAVVLRHVQGLSYEESSTILEQPIGTTKSDVHRGLRLLREALSDEREPSLTAGR